jgi:hypothetical protein
VRWPLLTANWVQVDGKDHDPSEFEGGYGRGCGGGQIFVFRKSKDHFVNQPSQYIQESSHQFDPTAETTPDFSKEAVKPLSIAEQTEWIKNEFHAADPNEQEWCKTALLEGTYWHSKTLTGGAQFSQDIFLARNLFFERYIRRSSVKGYYVEAGANHYKQLSSTYFFDKCLGWDGLCVEPQKQYHSDIKSHRSCKLVPMCLTKERTDNMMIGGLPPHRGAGMFIKSLPEDGNLPNDGKHWERISCAPLVEVLNEYAQNNTKHHVDLFVLDVEGAELPVLDTIDWEKISFTLLQIEVDKMKGPVQEQLKDDMSKRGYELAYRLVTDSIFAVKEDVEAGFLPTRNNLWEPADGILGLKE